MNLIYGFEHLCGCVCKNSLTHMYVVCMCVRVCVCGMYMYVYWKLSQAELNYNKMHAHSWATLESRPYYYVSPIASAHGFQLCKHFVDIPCQSLIITAAITECLIRVGHAVLLKCMKVFGHLGYVSLLEVGSI